MGKIDFGSSGRDQDRTYYLHQPTIMSSRSRNTQRGQRTNTRAPRRNEKTVLCKFFDRDGKCPYGNRCTFAHGKAQISASARKPKTPCWYFNSGGCSKSAEQCSFDHVLAPNMRKPLHLQHPCPFYHYRTPLECRRGEKCGGDHFYELTADEWNHHFPEAKFPGVGYFEFTKEPEPEIEPEREPEQQFVADAFPVLGTTPPAPRPVVGAWGKSLTFNDNEEDIVDNTPRRPKETKSTKVRNPYSQGSCWADWEVSEEEYWDDNQDDDEEDLAAAPAPKIDYSNPNRWQQYSGQGDWRTGDGDHFSHPQATGKMPAMDGELKQLVTTALKELLDSQ